MIETLENLYRAHRQGLYTFALSITCCSTLAEDAIQVAFTRLVQKKLDVSCEEELVAYVFKAVRNSAIDLCRTNQRQQRLSVALFEQSRAPSRLETPDDQLLVKERDEILKNAIDELSPVDREAIVLKFFAGLTFDQAGKVTETSPKTIATRYRRALGKLENHLKDQF